MERLNILLARSFWAQIFAIVAAGLTIGGVEPIDAGEYTEAVMAFITAGLGLWAYLERLFGKMKLVAPWDV